MKEENLRREAYQIYFQILVLYGESVILVQQQYFLFLNFHFYILQHFNYVLTINVCNEQCLSTKGTPSNTVRDAKSLE